MRRAEIACGLVLTSLAARAAPPVLTGTETPLVISDSLHEVAQPAIAQPFVLFVQDNSIDGAARLFDARDGSVRTIESGEVTFGQRPSVSHSKALYYAVQLTLDDLDSGIKTFLTDDS